MQPRPNDVIISNRSATVEHDVNIVSQGVCLTCPDRGTAETKGRELAEAYEVDLWVTEDQTHFMLVASYRGGGVRTNRRASGD